MKGVAEDSRIIRFGAFELDGPAEELRQQGLKIRLQEQPLRILQMLVANPGELVSREELRAALWPSNSYVDFDQGLNRAINKLREALGDSADNPRFIETLSRRGYRFIAPVASNGQKVTATGPAAAWHKQDWKVVTLVSLVVIAGILAAVAIWRWRHPRPLTEKDFIVLGD